MHGIVWRLSHTLGLTRERRAGPYAQRWRRPVLLALVFCAFTVSAHAQQNQDRVALVIGNSQYGDLTPLDNPYNDARGMAAVLWQAGFETIEVIDATREEMIAAIATFTKRIQPGTDAVFFYAGHGVQSSGANYLLPVDTQVAHATDLDKYGVDANDVTALMANRDARINIVILDACRDNPFAAYRSSLFDEIREFDEELLVSSPNTEVVVRSSAGGLAPLTIGRTETVVGYATGPGEVALDGTQGNSPYTYALLQYLNTPGLEIGMLFRRVRASVREQTQGQQIPWMASTLESEFYFRPPEESAAITLAEAEAERQDDIRKLGLAPPQQLVEEAFWRVVESDGGRTEYLAYLERYPKGLFAEEARAKLAMLDLGTSLPEPTDVAAAEAASGRFTAYLGVGPVAVDLGAILTRSGSEPAMAYQIETLPGAGSLFRPDDTPVRAGHLLSAQELAELRFLPRVGSKRVGLAEPIRLVPIDATRGGEANALDFAITSQIHPCDLLAGFRHAPDRVWDGIQQAILNLDPEPAIEACELAVKDYPEVVRFQALLARANRAAENWPEARRWSQQAAESGYAPGMSQLGTMMIRGNGGEPDYTRAFDLFQRGYELGNPASALRLGEMYEHGLGVEQDYAAAIEWFDNGIELGNAFAGTSLAQLYEDGRGVEQDLERAVELYQQAADAGELTAQLRLGRMYLDGRGVAQDTEQAREWFRAAAGVGMPEAQKALGQYYAELADEEARDVQAAIGWFEKADANGDAWAPYYLGELIQASAVPDADPEQAPSFFERAVDRGNTDAARALAKLYETDTLGAPQPEEALRWHRVAAEGGNVWSMRDLAKALQSGDAIPANQNEAATWLKRAADGGNPWAQRDWGTVLIEGDLASADPIEAVRYLGLAVASEDEGAAESATQRLEKRLDRQERVRAAQNFLNELGYDAGPADGVAGARTLEALDRARDALRWPEAAVDSPELLARLAHLVTSPER